MKYFHAAGVVLTVLAISLVGLYGYRNQPAHVRAVEAPAPEASMVPLPTPPPPICVNQNCHQRPKFLECAYESVNGQYSTRYCTRWEIQYEHHCDCDRWAPAP